MPSARFTSPPIEGNGLPHSQTSPSVAIAHGLRLAEERQPSATQGRSGLGSRTRRRPPFDAAGLRWISSYGPRPEEPGPAA